ELWIDATLSEQRPRFTAACRSRDQPPPGCPVCLRENACPTIPGGRSKGLESTSELSAKKQTLKEIAARASRSRRAPITARGGRLLVDAQRGPASMSASASAAPLPPTGLRPVKRWRARCPSSRRRTPSRRRPLRWWAARRLHRPRRRRAARAGGVLVER